MNFIKSALSILSVGIMISSCATNQTISFINDDLDLRDYNTYRLIQVNTNDENFSVDGMVFFSQLEKAIFDNMDRRLFTKSNSPDLIVRYELVSGQRTQTNTTNYYNSYAYYSPYRTSVTNYIEDILIIEFRDRKKKKLVWQGSLDLQLRQGEPEDAIKDAVNEIFETYPYQAGSYNKVIDDSKR